jgi:hypothetical protein
VTLRRPGELAGRRLPAGLRWVAAWGCTWAHLGREEVEAGPERVPSVARGEGGAELPPELAGPAVVAVKRGGDDGLGVGEV